MKIPGIYVDAIVVGSPEDNNQCLGMPYDGALSVFLGTLVQLAAAVPGIGKGVQAHVGDGSDVVGPRRWKSVLRKPGTPAT